MTVAGRNPLTLIRRAAWPAAGMLVIVYFLGAAIVGENGVLAWGDYRRVKAERSVSSPGWRKSGRGSRTVRSCSIPPMPIPTSSRSWSGASSAWSAPTR